MIKVEHDFFVLE